jgi:PelA/Pel-15E family pectate lyase
MLSSGTISGILPNRRVVALALMAALAGTCLLGASLSGTGTALAQTAAAPAGNQPAQAPNKTQIEETQIRETMKRATQFMVDKVAYKGGYVWSYLPDFSRRWGEMEANPTMIWIQPPGTATMGHVFLDAYHATGDDYYYQAAEQVAGALIWGQHPSGGWHYMVDFGGEGSIRHWYDTIGKNGWRLEEFFHYYGNATFDDAGTSEASQFLLRLYAEKRDPKYKPALDKAIQFVLDSQYPIGGWPQRYPLSKEYSHHGKPDYTSFITLNDDVAGENIKFLIMCYQALGEQRVLDPVIRAMNSFLVLQQGQPQPGWGLQYKLDLKPVGARSYEPDALTTHTSANAIEQLMNFYTLTGDTKFLARIPEALDWLDKVKLPPELVKNNRTHPTFIELGTDKPLFVHRRGSNVVNGEYYVDHNPENTVVHYSSTRAVDVPKLRRRYEALKATPPAEVTRNSPLKATAIVELPRFFTLQPIEVSDLNVNSVGAQGAGVPSDKIAKMIADLNGQGYWPTELKAMSNPYRSDGSATPAPGDFSQTRVGDETDTSPFITDTPPIGISTGTYIENMSALIASLAHGR